ncbi:MAG: response regulator transcription factor [Candidatus Nanopelagicales bacterium]
MTRVLVIEDEESFRDALGFMLRKEGYDVDLAPDGIVALEQFERTGADLVLLDLMLPGLSGMDVCRAIRRQSRVPIIMVTAKDTEIDKVVGLELGADDYVTKPFSSRELTARIKAVLRRGPEIEVQESTTVEAGPVRMDVERHVVTVRGEDVALPLKEFDLLELLLRNNGRVLTRDVLIDRVWGSDYVGDTKTLDVHVKRLRSKIESDPANPEHLLTVRGLGYKFEA